ncbi:MAG TPA: class III poly(R)-hydroxyalkanoic acid synthase subunit PhaC, partial [Gammaproteobacteria bacterium]|nr:class III poly(R)-hydroxyalkanoic acid synthase subunit PhaC [Gammaproteobacteria bacterium]
MEVYSLLEKFPRAQILECAKEMVYAQDKIKLYRYVPMQAKRHAKPLLVMFALVNRPYIIDLQPDRSLIRPLLEAGFEVYLIDWGYPDASDAHLTLEDYILRYLDGCVDFIRQTTSQNTLDLLGICQGGTFGLCYSALFPEKINKLVTMITAVDFHTADNTLTELIERMDVEKIIAQYKNMPGWLLNLIFFSLKPAATHWLKYQRMLKEDPFSEKMALFLRMEHWLHDTTDQAGAAFMQYVTQLYQQNKLVRNQFYLNNRLVDLKQITHPVLNIYALHDDIIPPSATQCLGQYICSRDYQHFTFDGGHIGIYSSHKAQQCIPPAISKWLMQ